MRAKVVGRRMVAVCVCVVALAVGSPAQGARSEETLSWDDGDYDYIGNHITGQVGMGLAVMFEAPQWANWITEIHYFIMDDFIENPDDPSQPTTSPFSVCVWAPTGAGMVFPGEQVNEYLTTEAHYPEDAWLQFVLPEAVYVGDAVQFPDRVFFVGLEFLSRNNPGIAFDSTDPVDAQSRRFNWVEWELVECGDIMIRAVVSDSWGSPVERGSWGVIKGMFR